MCSLLLCACVLGWWGAGVLGWHYAGVLVVCLAFCSVYMCKVYIVGLCYGVLVV
jgi:hypothetical protein